MLIEHPNEQTIAIRTTSGILFKKEIEISYCQVQGSYTYLYLDDPNNKKITISKPLNAVLDTLSSNQFCRIHQSFAVNLLHIIRYDGAPKNCVTMSNGVSLPVSRSHKEDLLDRFS